MNKYVLCLVFVGVPTLATKVADGLQHQQISMLL
jgi:hypothetical protein